MRSIQLSTDVVSIGELKVQAAKLLRRIHENRRPIVVTQHGKPTAVILTPEDYDHLAEHLRFVNSVRRGLAEASRGELIDDSALDAELDIALGPREKK